MADADISHASEIGEKVRSARKEAGLSLRELAANAEISASMLSQIENGKSYPSVRTLYDIADLLELPMDHFFPSLSRNQSAAAVEGAVEVVMTASELREAHQQGKINFEDIESSTVLHADARPTIVLNGGVVWSRLTPQREPDAEFLEIMYEPGASSGNSFSHHEGREFFLVMSGTLTIELAFEEHTLKAGDTIIFNSETPHRLTNDGDVPVRAITIIIDRAERDES